MDSVTVVFVVFFCLATLPARCSPSCWIPADFCLICRPPGPEQETDPEGSGVRHVAAAPRVHAGAGVQAAELGAANSGRPDPDAAPDRTDQPDGVQQTARTRTSAETRHGGPAAAQEPQGTREKPELCFTC